MGVKFTKGERYAGRREDIGVISFSMPRDALALLRQYGSGKTLERFIARLVYEHQARLEERAKMREQRADVVDTKG